MSYNYTPIFVHWQRIFPHSGASFTCLSTESIRLAPKNDQVQLVTDFATDSLLDLHPPRIFQIDGNLGGAAAVLEMLLHSYRGELHLLPALPPAWPEGRVSGLRARGGVTVAMAWRAGELVEATLESRIAGPVTVLRASEHWQVVDAAGRDVSVTRNGHRITFPLNPGEPRHVQPVKSWEPRTAPRINGISYLGPSHGRT